LSDSNQNVLSRFDGLAAGYDRHRPSYPAAAIDYLIRVCALVPGSRVVDVGCGTGISTRLLAARGLEVIGIEPNADMRRQAELIGCPAGPAASFREGRAEATGLPDACASLVIAAQAFHWFANESSLREFHRLLRPGGWVALIWNEQDRNDPFTAAYFDALVRHSPEPHLATRAHAGSGEKLLNYTLFEQRQRIEFPHDQKLDHEQLIGRAFSASYAPREGDAKQKLVSELDEAFAKYQCDGQVSMRYQTVVYLGKKPVHG
jgi:ubiquinone/menaquinone biosynthesis C-methylase UbiE